MINLEVDLQNISDSDDEADDDDDLKDKDEQDDKDEDENGETYDSLLDREKCGLKLRKTPRSLPSPRRGKTRTIMSTINQQVARRRERRSQVRLKTSLSEKTEGSLCFYFGLKGFKNNESQWSKI